MFKVGQKVVCVEPIDDLIKHNIYTVRKIRDGYDGKDVVLTVHLEEIYLPINEFGIEIGYKATRFRPLDHQFAEDVIKMICEQPETVEV